MAQLSKKKVAGLLLCLGSVAILTAGWTYARSNGRTATDNAYIRGDVTALAPKVGGYVTEVDVADNQSVRVGDVLFRIDDRDYRARLAQAVADIASAEARLTFAEAQIELQHALVREAEADGRAAAAQLKLAGIASERRHKLIRSKTIGQEEVDESDAALARAKAGVAAAKAKLEAEQQRIAVLETERAAAEAELAHARASRDLAQIDLDDTVVRAPVNGVIGNRQVRVGRLVAPGTPLLDIVPVEDVWVVANFKETQVEHIQPGQSVRITVDGFPDQVLDGVVDSFAPGSGSAFSMLPADNATGNFVRVVQRVPVKIRFAGNPLPGRIVPGLSARVEVEIESGS